MADLPSLPLSSWNDTRTALHLYLQVLGKVRMALHPKQNHWWHVTLRAGPRGFTTGPIPVEDGRSLEVELDVVESRATFACSAGGGRNVPIADGLTVASFYEQVMGVLAELGYTPAIVAKPYDPPKVGSDVPFADDDAPRPWDADAVQRFWAIVRWATAVLPFAVGRVMPEPPAGMDIGMVQDWTWWTPFSYPFNLTQQPAIVQGCGFSDSHQFKC